MNLTGMGMGMGMGMAWAGQDNDLRPWVVVVVEDWWCSVALAS